jgi:hypothetical protein
MSWLLPCAVANPIEAIATSISLVDKTVMRYFEDPLKLKAEL